MKQRFESVGNVILLAVCVNALGWSGVTYVRRGWERESAGKRGHFLFCLAGRTVWVCGGLLRTSPGQR